MSRRTLRGLLLSFPVKASPFGVNGVIQVLAWDFRWNLGVDLRREVSVTGRGLC